MIKSDDRNNDTPAFADRFAPDSPPGPSADEARSPTTMPSGRPGVEALVQQRVNANDEASAAAKWLLDLRRSGHAWRDMVVVAPGKRNWRDPIAKALLRESIPGRMMLGDPSSKPDFTGDHVHVMTLHAVEGLEFPAVAVLGIGDLPWKTQTLEEAARLLDRAMTRATHALLVSHSKKSMLVERLLSSGGSSYTTGYIARK